MNVRLRHVLSHLHGVSGLRVPYRMNYEEIYQTDVLNLPAEVTYAHNLPVNSPHSICDVVQFGNRPGNRVPVRK